MKKHIANDWQRKPRNDLIFITILLLLLRYFKTTLSKGVQMKYPQAFIYSGLFFLLLGIGDNNDEVIPSDIKIFSGIACIAYGVLLHFQKTKSFRFEKLDFNWHALNSKVYFIIGILLIKIENLSDFFDDKFWLTVWLGVVGLAFLCYGLNLHFKEKKEKRESGNIEEN